MKALDQYRRERAGKAKLDLKVRSVSIDASHDAFIRKHDLNLSKMVRDLIDAMMLKGKK